MLRDHLVNAEMLREEIDSLLSLGIFFSIFFPFSGADGHSRTKR